ncbi:aspartate kinase, partial [Acidaminococcus fermentans]|uniref:aspartate kinase n=1 Tax=Acidaminococcus fermentans TaxID=905 RepID=UPI002E75B1CA
MKIIVQKFGGTSVATPATREKVVGKVQEAVAQGYAPIVVVSAMGRRGDPFATDTMIDMLKSVNPNPAPHELDLLMACGEIISSTVMAATLQERGLKAKALTGGQAGMITDDEYGNAKIRTVEPDNLLELVEQGIIPVVCGFQGVTADHKNVTTLGRGGSDTSAAAFGVAVHADKVEIYTDVDGVMTADPRIVKNAHIIKQISYDEIREMAHQGAKVIHPRAVEIVMRYGVPMVVKSTFSEAPGTLISKEDQPKEMEETDSLEEKHACGVASKNNIAFFSVNLDSSDGADLFDTLAKNGVSIGTMSLQPHSLMFAVYSAAADDAEKVLKAENCQYTKVENCAKVTVVGSHMGGVPGIMAR